MMDAMNWDALNVPSIACCLCGVEVTPPNASNMCVICLRSQVDITVGIPKQVPIQWCRGCGRYLEPPNRWMKCTLESKELLTFCLRRVKGLNQVKLVDANFVWTEPHSKRLKVKVTCQKEVYSSTILEQVFVVEFTILNHFCNDCHRTEAFNASGGIENNWVAVAQVRQHVDHKRTFYWLEQMMLRHNAHVNTMSIRENTDGLDMYFGSLSHCKQLIDFLQSVVPMRYRQSKQLIGHDTKSNTYSYKWSFSVEIVPICRDDFVILPYKLSQQLGGFGPCAVCIKISNMIHLLDPFTLQTKDMMPNTFWSNPFRSLASKRQLTKFIVLDTEAPQPYLKKANQNTCQLSNITVARDSDFGLNDTQFNLMTYLGERIKPGKFVMGYDLTTLNNITEDYLKVKYVVPFDVVLIKSSFKRNKLNGKGRYWKLKSFTESANGQEEKSAWSERDYEEFLRELEENPELRCSINLYKDSNFTMEKVEKIDEDESECEGDMDLPPIQMEELLDDFVDLQISSDRSDARS